MPPISAAELERQLNLGRSLTNIADQCCVDRKTVARWQRSLGVPTYTSISSTALDAVVRSVRGVHNKNIGRSNMDGVLRGLGLRVRQRDIGASLTRVNPQRHLNQPCLLKAKVHSKSYLTNGAGFLTGIDGGEKSVRYGFHTTCSIDCETRLIYNLDVDTDKCAGTVLRRFAAGVHAIGDYLPRAARFDGGTENVGIITLLYAYDRGVITGKSTGNQRVERSHLFVSLEPLPASHYARTTAREPLFIFGYSRGLTQPLCAHLHLRLLPDAQDHEQGHGQVQGGGDAPGRHV